MSAARHADSHFYYTAFRPNCQSNSRNFRGLFSLLYAFIHFAGERNARICNGAGGTNFPLVAKEKALCV